MAYQSFQLKNQEGKIINGYAWQTNKKYLGNVVIAHGMAEHCLRYDEFAKFLNDFGYNVYMVDQVSHGANCSKEKLGVWPRNGFRLCISNLHSLITQVSMSLKPIYLIGHSMGSFVSQKYYSKYSNTIDGLVLIGTSGHQGIFTFNAKLTNFLSHFMSENQQEKPSKFFSNLMSFAYNSKVKKVKDENGKTKKLSKNQWISTNEENVKLYDEDPLCGFTCSFSFYRELFNGTKNLHKAKILASIEKKIPILLISGAEDPVSQYGKGIYKLARFYKKADLNPQIIIYPSMRHEVLNEAGKEKVYQDILSFIQKI